MGYFPSRVYLSGVQSVEGGCGEGAPSPHPRNRDYLRAHTERTYAPRIPRAPTPNVLGARTRGMRGPMYWAREARPRHSEQDAGRGRPPRILVRLAKLTENKHLSRDVADVRHLCQQTPNTQNKTPLFQRRRSKSATSLSPPLIPQNKVHPEALPPTHPLCGGECASHRQHSRTAVEADSGD